MDRCKFNCMGFLMVNLNVIVASSWTNRGCHLIAKWLHFQVPKTYKRTKFAFGVDIKSMALPLPLSFIRLWLWSWFMGGTPCQASWKYICLFYQIFTKIHLSLPSILVFKQLLYDIFKFWCLYIHSHPADLLICFANVSEHNVQWAERPIRGNAHA